MSDFTLEFSKAVALLHQLPDGVENQNQPSCAEWFEWLARLSEEYKNEHMLASEEVARWKP